MDRHDWRSNVAAKLSWKAEATNQTTHTEGSRDVDVSRARGILTYQVRPSAAVIGVRWIRNEQLQSSRKNRASRFTAAAQWSPTVRTNVSNFMRSGRLPIITTLLLQHRTPRTAWRFTDRQDVTTLPNQLAVAPPGTAFDLLFNALTSQIPDPLLRAQEAQRQLQQSGTPPICCLPDRF